jgi:hypothetical protein
MIANSQPVLRYKTNWAEVWATLAVTAAFVAFITVAFYMASDAMIEKSRANYIEPYDRVCVMIDGTSDTQCGTVVFKGEDVYRP